MSDPLIYHEPCSIIESSNQGTNKGENEMAQSIIFNAYYQEKFIGEVSAPDAEAAIDMLTYDRVAKLLAAKGINMESDDYMDVGFEIVADLKDQFRVVTVK